MQIYSSRSFFAVVLSISIILQNLSPSVIYAQEPSKATPVVISPKIDTTRQSVPPNILVFNQLYSAISALNDVNKWRIVKLNLQLILNNSSDLLPDGAIVRIKKALDQISGAPTHPSLKSIFSNERKVFEPYLQTQRILNEALMLLRVKLNKNSDHDLLAVKALVKTYLFPGEDGKLEDYLEFPPPATYNAALFTLSEEYLKGTETAAADEVTDSRLANPADKPLRFVDIVVSLSKFVGGIIKAHLFPSGSPPKIDDKDLKAVPPKDEKDPKSVPGSSVDFVGVDQDTLNKMKDYLVKESERNQKLIESMKETNRYLEWSLLLQAIVDPSSAQSDAQLAAFIKGVKVTVPLVMMDLKPQEKQSLEEILKAENRGIGANTPLRLVQVDKYSAWLLIWSGNPLQLIPGSYQYVPSLGLLRIMAGFTEDYDVFLHFKDLAKANVVTHATLGFAKNMAQVSVNFIRDIFFKEGFKASLFGAASNAVSGTASAGGQVYNSLTIKFNEYVTKITENKFVKNNWPSKIIFILQATQIVINTTVEYNLAWSKTQRMDVLAKGISQGGAAALYLINKWHIQWIAMTDDALHFLFPSVPSSDQIIYSLIRTAPKNLHYRIATGNPTCTGVFYYWCRFWSGKDSTYATVLEFEKSIGLEQNEHFQITESDTSFLRASQALLVAKSNEELNAAIINLKSDLATFSLKAMTTIYTMTLLKSNQIDNGMGERVQDYYNVILDIRQKVANLKSDKFDNGLPALRARIASMAAAQLR